MKETRFIAQNKEKWLESEKLLEEPSKDPEKLTNLFTQVIDDLSFSRTYYPNRSVRVYLNKIAREYFSIIYSHQKDTKNRFRYFWLEELPQIVLFCRKQLIVSLLVFLLAAAIGVFSSMKDPQFASSILGETYVSMTKANIERGDPMAVYKQSHEVDMFLGITFNNLMVAFRTYVFGIFLSVGTLAILLYNGIMVGCFQFFFIERGLFAESALTIWLHGTLEISSIIIAGGAGLTLGSGLVFPGTYSRLQAFQISAIRSLKLMLGITPIFVLAALIESFLTRYTDAPDFLRLLLILISAGLIVGYFVVYPWLKARRGFTQKLEEVRLAPSLDEPIVTDRIKNAAEIIKDAFMFYRQSFNRLLTPIVLITLAMTAAQFFLTERFPERYLGEWWVYILDDLFYALETPEPVHILINSAGTGLIIYLVVWLLDNTAKGLKLKKTGWQSLIQIQVITLMIYGMLYYLEGWGTFILTATFVMAIISAFTQHTEDTGIVKGVSRALNLSFSNFRDVMGLQLVLLLLTFSFLLILSAPLLYMYNSIFRWNFAETDEWARSIVEFLEIFIKLLGFNMLLPILAASSSFLYFTLKEISTADNLKKAISLIGSKDSKFPKR